VTTIYLVTDLGGETARVTDTERAARLSRWGYRVTARTV